MVASRLSLCSPIFLRARCTRMGAHDGAINHAVFPVRIVGYCREQPLPDTGLAPAHEPLIHAVPRPKLGRQQPSLRPTAAHPFHRFDKATARLRVFADVRMGLLAQEVPDLRRFVRYGATPASKAWMVGIPTLWRPMRATAQVKSLAFGLALRYSFHRACRHIHTFPHA